MTTYLPYRANVFCNLGHLIDGQFADTYLQQAGLIFCRGSMRLAGIVRPDVGTVVSFAYTRDNVKAARIPRVLRVLSSFADPFTNVTTVQLGCKLTMLQENREPEARATPGESDPTLPVDWEEYIAAPVRAEAVATKCLQKLGITAAGAIPLQNRFTRDDIDLSEGYVDVLGKLLESENYVGWLNENEQLQIRSLLESDFALGPVFSNTNVFTLGPIGVGSLPGEAVSVSYSPLRLKPFSITVGVSPRLTEVSGWTSGVTYGPPTNYSIVYPAVVPGPTPGTETSVTVTETRSYIPVQETRNLIVNGLLNKSSTYSLAPFRAVAPIYASQAREFGIEVPNIYVQKRSETTNRYYDDKKLWTATVLETVSSAEFYGKLNLDFVFSSSDRVLIPTDGEIVTQLTVTTYKYAGQNVYKYTERYQNWATTQEGQQGVAQARNYLRTSGDVSDFINTLSGPPAYMGTETAITDNGPQPQQQRSLGPAALAEVAYSKDVERTERTEETAYVYGSSNAERVVNFRLPYTGDDYFLISGSAWVPFRYWDRARSVAMNYGRVQNRLRLGNSQGVSIQVPVELLPTAPFDALYLQAGGLTGQYRANGMSWTFDQNGIVGQVDALFWLAIGQDASPGPVWFPVAPGVTVLPTTPGPTVNTTPAPANSASVPAGWNPAAPDLGALFGALPTGVAPVFPTTLDVPVGLEPFNETVEVEAMGRAVFEIEDLPYSLTPQEADLDLVGASVFVMEEIAYVGAPLTALTLAAFAPAVFVPVVVSVPAAALTLTAFPPDINTSVTVNVPLTALTLTAFAPTLNLLSVPLATLTLTSYAPTVSAAETDPYFADVSLLLHMDGTNASTTFTDSSTNALTVTATSIAQISTAQPRFGTGALYTTRSGGTLSLPATDLLQLTGDFTIEFWVYAIQDRGYLFKLSGTLDRIEINQNTAAEVGANAYKIYMRNNDVELFDNVAVGLAQATYRHIAITRSGTSMRLFGGGTLYSTASHSSTVTLTAISGAGQEGNFDGYIDEVRITKGVARYTASFTPPTAPFPTS